MDSLSQLTTKSLKLSLVKHTILVVSCWLTKLCVSSVHVQMRKSGRGRLRIAISELLITKLIKSKSTKIQEAQNPKTKNRSEGTIEQCNFHHFGSGMFFHSPSFLFPSFWYKLIFVCPWDFFCSGFFRCFFGKL